MACPVLPTYVSAAAVTRGAAAAKAAQHKRSKYRTDNIPGFVFFLPLAFETEGYHTDDLDKLLLGMAKMRAAADGLVGVELKRRSSMWIDFWLAQFAIVHARYLARCILHRAAVCKGAASPPFTRASFVDVSRFYCVSCDAAAATTAAAAAAAAGQRQRRRARACPLRDHFLSCHKRTRPPLSHGSRRCTLC